MTQADSVHSTPPINTSALPPIDPPPTPPAEPQEPALYIRTPVTPEEAFQAIWRLRKEARDEIERLLTFLDESDDHMEREPDGDELDASYPEGGTRLLGHPEEDAEDAGDAHEPSLGAVEDHPNGYFDSSDFSGHGKSQAHWASGSCDDREEEEDDDDIETEPSLGWTASGVIQNTGVSECDVEGDEHDGGEPDENIEPSLGWPERDSQQVWPAAGGDYLHHDMGELS